MLTKGEGSDVGTNSYRKSDTKCTLRPEFTDPNAPDMLTIDRFGPTDEFQLTLGSTHLARYQQGQRLWVHYKPGERSPARVLVRTPVSFAFSASSLACRKRTRVDADRLPSYGTSTVSSAVANVSG